MFESVLKQLVRNKLLLKSRKTKMTEINRVPKKLYGPIICRYDYAETDRKAKLKSRYVKHSQVYLYASNIINIFIDSHDSAFSAKSK